MWLSLKILVAWSAASFAVSPIVGRFLAAGSGERRAASNRPDPARLVGPLAQS